MTGPGKPLRDLQMAELVALEAEFARRSRGLCPWSIADYLDKVAAIHVRYAWLTRYQGKELAA